MARPAPHDGLVRHGIVGAALFPRLAYLARRPTRLGLRGRMAYTAFNALLLFAIRQFVLPRLKQIEDERQQAKDQLRQQLGREPTEREIFEELGLFPES